MKFCDKFKRWLSANRREAPDRPSILAFSILMVWFGGNLLSPYLAPAGTIYFGNDGLVGSGDNAYEISQIDSGFARFFYKAGDANCHQHADRSFFLHGNQMPFCARCTSIFFGLVLGAGVMIFLSLELNVFWILLGLAPMALDGGIQLLGLFNYESTNLMRFLTGSMAGLVTGIALGYIVSELTKIAVIKTKIRKGG
ncbi:MAG: DUF2085 domain-containing protein [Thermoplasmata archaeon]|nr:DUF2085 domain-containing protein [Thermoplasmata archaeon]